MTVSVADTDLVSPAAVRDPHAVFAGLHAAGPVHFLPRHRAWVLLDYDLVRLALSDERLSTDTISPMYDRLSADARARYRDAEELLRGWMIFNDPPVHTRLRDPVRTAFTPRGVAALRDEIGDLTDELLDGLGDSCEFVREVAFPLPAAVIAMLLGVPAGRFEQMGEWSKQLGSLVMGKVSRADAWDRALAAAQDMQRSFGELVEHHRHVPGDNLVARMVHPPGAPAGPELTHEQLVGACSLLLFAGHETTTSLLTTAIYHLAQRPDDRRRIAADTALVPTMVEEMLRYDGPSKIVVRRVRATGDWQGYPFEAGQAVFCALAAANRDPAQFERPDELDLGRHPNRHLGFGWGMHFCLGAQLAKLEAEVVIPRVLTRFPALTLACAPADLSWHPTVVGRTLRALPLRLT